MINGCTGTISKDASYSYILFTLQDPVEHVDCGQVAWDTSTRKIYAIYSRGTHYSHKSYKSVGNGGLDFDNPFFGSGKPTEEYVALSDTMSEEENSDIWLPGATLCLDDKGTQLTYDMHIVATDGYFQFISVARYARLFGEYAKMPK